MELLFWGMSGLPTIFVLSAVASRFGGFENPFSLQKISDCFDYYVLRNTVPRSVRDLLIPLEQYVANDQVLDPKGRPAARTQLRSILGAEHTSNAVVFGPYGTGKTALASHEVLQFCRRTGRKAFIVNNALIREPSLWARFGSLLSGRTNISTLIRIIEALNREPTRYCLLVDEAQDLFPPGDTKPFQTLQTHLAQTSTPVVLTIPLTAWDSVKPIFTGSNQRRWGRIELKPMNPYEALDCFRAGVGDFVGQDFTVQDEALRALVWIVQKLVIEKEEGFVFPDRGAWYLRQIIAWKREGEGVNPRTALTAAEVIQYFWIILKNQTPGEDEQLRNIVTTAEGEFHLPDQLFRQHFRPLAQPAAETPSALRSGVDLVQTAFIDGKTVVSCPSPAYASLVAQQVTVEAEPWLEVDLAHLLSLTLAQLKSIIPVMRARLAAPVRLIIRNGERLVPHLSTQETTPPIANAWQETLLTAAGDLGAQARGLAAGAAHTLNSIGLAGAAQSVQALAGGAPASAPAAPTAVVTAPKAAEQILTILGEAVRAQDSRALVLVKECPALPAGYNHVALPTLSLVEITTLIMQTTLPQTGRPPLTEPAVRYAVQLAADLYRQNGPIPEMAQQILERARQRGGALEEVALELAVRQMSPSVTDESFARSRQIMRALTSTTLTRVVPAQIPLSAPCVSPLKGLTLNARRPVGYIKGASPQRQAQIAAELARGNPRACFRLDLSALSTLLTETGQRQEVFAQAVAQARADLRANPNAIVLLSYHPDLKDSLNALLRDYPEITFILFVDPAHSFDEERAAMTSTTSLFGGLKSGLKSSALGWPGPVGSVVSNWSTISTIANDPTRALAELASGALNRVEAAASQAAAQDSGAPLRPDNYEFFSLGGLGEGEVSLYVSTLLPRLIAQYNIAVIPPELGERLAKALALLAQRDPSLTLEWVEQRLHQIFSTTQAAASTQLSSNLIADVLAGQDYHLRADLLDLLEPSASRSLLAKMRHSSRLIEGPVHEIAQILSPFVKYLKILLVAYLVRKLWSYMPSIPYFSEPQITTFVPTGA